MNQLKGYVKIIVGCFLVSIGLNLFIIPCKLIPSETLGLINILSYRNNIINLMIL